MKSINRGRSSELDANKALEKDVLLRAFFEFTVSL
jgi:hypothetical protein